MNPTRSTRLALALALAPLLAAPSPLGAELVRQKEWDRSPEYLLLATPDEQAAWKKVATDEEGDRFIALFWARRDPDLKTPQNEFRQRFELLVAKADELFKTATKRGALTERGRLLVLVGPPKSMTQKVDSSAESAVGQTTGFSATGGGGTQLTFVFTYEEAQLPRWSDLKTLVAQIRVDRGTGSETILGNISDVMRLEKKAVEAALVHPELREPPAPGGKSPAPAVAAKPGAPAGAVPASQAPLSAATRERLEALLAQGPHGPITVVPLADAGGVTRLHVQLFLRGDQLRSGEGATLALLVKGADGSDAARREEPAGLGKVGGDWYLDRALPLGPGEYDLAAAVLDGAGQPLVSARRRVRVPAPDAEFSVSPVVLATVDVEAEAGRSDAPFVFSSRKLVARGDGLFDARDGLSYALRVYNPGVDPATRKIRLARSLTIKGKNSAPLEIPLPPDQPAAVPETKEGTGHAVVLDLAGNIIEAGLGEYFRPGDYEFRLRVVDNVRGKSVEVVAPFHLAVPGAPAGSPPAPR